MFVLLVEEKLVPMVQEELSEDTRNGTGRRSATLLDDLRTPPLFFLVNMPPPYNPSM